MYGPSSSNDRVEFWTELSRVAGLWKCPWVVGGDFNCIRFPSEKKGGSVITSALRDFSDWIRRNYLVDLPFQGADFTWSNMQRDPIVRRLDRFLVCSEWLDIFPDCIERALARPISVHCPILVETDLEDWGPPLFLFELMWISKTGIVLENGGLSKR